MTTPFKAVKVCDNVYWVGAIDWTLRDFHGYATTRATTYNAFLIVSDKITLIDTVKAPFMHEMMSRIASVVDPAKIDYIVSHHTEMDHSGCLPQVMEAVKPEKLYASSGSVDAMLRHFNRDLRPTVVKDGETIDIGGMKLTFIDTRMLHWPESNVSYLHERELLFSQDIFGMHLATSERFEDEVPHDVVYFEGAKYFANIVLPYSPLVIKLLDRVQSLGLKFSLIAPDHGPIWRRDTGRILDYYRKWALQKPTAKAVVVYDTMWNSTAAMARSIGDGLAEEGISVRLMGMGANHRSDVATELLECGALLVGSPTINNQLFPTIADVLSYLKGLKPRNLVGGVFGSYGWSGEGTKLLEAALDEMKVERVVDTVSVKYVPSDEILAKCREMGMKVGKVLKARLGN
ncbi:MAG: FprA family A-type flavoprotein [Planctomycetota bacterium]